jgi:hypothetical protein
MGFSRFGDPNAAANTHYVVQPSSAPGNVHTWSMPDVGASQHQLAWSRDRIDFARSAGGGLNHSWSFADAAGILDPSDARPRINLWLFRGQAPLDGRSIEVVISDFRFTPA